MRVARSHHLRPNAIQPMALPLALPLQPRALMMLPRRAAVHLVPITALLVVAVAACGDASPGTGTMSSWHVGPPGSHAPSAGASSGTNGGGNAAPPSGSGSSNGGGATPGSNNGGTNGGS